MRKIALVVALFVSLIAFPGNEPCCGKGGKCTGSKSCSACTNCSRCKHCGAGGVCGVCSPDSFVPKKKATPVKKVPAKKTVKKSK